MGGDGGGMPEGVGGAGWRGAKGENWDNRNSIVNKYNLKKERYNKDRGENV